MTTDERVRIEADSYLSYNVCDLDLQSKYLQNPLLFWKKHGSSYAILNQLASLFLGISAGSVPLESMFSVTWLICNGRRSRLSHDKLHKICFLHDNFDFIVDTDSDWR